MNYYDCKYVLFSDFNLYSCGCLKWGWVRILSFLVPILFCSGFLVQSLKQGDWWNQSLLFRIHVGTSCLKSHWQNQCRAMLLSLGACIFVIELKQGNSFPCSTWMHQERIVNEWIWVLLDCFFFLVWPFLKLLVKFWFRIQHEASFRLFSFLLGAKSRTQLLVDISSS